MTEAEIRTLNAQTEERMGSRTFCAEKFRYIRYMPQLESVASCCYIQNTKIDLSDLEEHPERLFYPVELQTERTRFLKSERPAACKFCWDEEDAGRISKRMKLNAMLEKDQEVTPENMFADSTQSLTKIELSFSNICTMKCMYCGPNYSSKWTEEISKHGPYLLGEEIKAKFKTITIDPKRKTDLIDDAFAKIWPRIYPRLKTIVVTGGEPLLDKNVYKVIDYSIGSPDLKKRFFITTSFSQPRLVADSFIAKIAKLENVVKECCVTVSADALDGELEYIRSGTNASFVFRNIETLLLDTKKTYLEIEPTITTLSLVNFPKLLDYITKLCALWPGRIRYHWNEVRYSDFLLPHILGEQKVLQVYSAAMEKAKELPSLNEDIPKRLKDSLDRSLWKIKHSPESVQRNRIEFKQFILESDKRRGTSFSDTFPDLMYLLD